MHHVSCAHCQSTCRVPRSALGKELRCANCHKTFRAKAAPRSKAPAASAPTPAPTTKADSPDALAAAIASGLQIDPPSAHDEPAKAEEYGFELYEGDEDLYQDPVPTPAEMPELTGESSGDAEPADGLPRLLDDDEADDPTGPPGYLANKPAAATRGAPAPTASGTGTTGSSSRRPFVRDPLAGAPGLAPRPTALFDADPADDGGSGPVGTKNDDAAESPAAAPAYSILHQMAIDQFEARQRSAREAEAAGDGSIDTLSIYLLLGWVFIGIPISLTIAGNYGGREMLGFVAIAFAMQFLIGLPVITLCIRLVATITSTRLPDTLWLRMYGLACGFCILFCLMALIPTAPLRLVGLVVALVLIPVAFKNFLEVSYGRALVLGIISPVIASMVFEAGGWVAGQVLIGLNADKIDKGSRPRGYTPVAVQPTEPSRSEVEAPAVAEAAAPAEPPPSAPQEQAVVATAPLAAAQAAARANAAAVAPSAPAAPPEPGDAQEMALRHLMSELASDNPGLRHAAALRVNRAVIPKASHQAVVDALTATLEGADAIAQVAVLQALAQFPELTDPAVFASRVNSEVTRLRSAALEGLAQFDGPRAAQAIAPLLATGEEAAVALLQSIGSAAEPAVLPYVEHPDVTVRRRAMQVLREIATVEAIPVLKRLAGGGDIALADDARALWTRIAPEALSPLTDARLDLAADDPLRQLRGAEALARIKPTAPDTRIARLLESRILKDDADLRPAFIAALAVWQDDATASNFLIYLTDVMPANKRIASIQALGKLGREEAVDPLIKRLLDDAPHTAEALVALGSIAEPAVRDLLESDEEAIVIEACRILAEIGTLPSLRPLVTLTMVPSRPKVVEAAREASDRVAARLRTLQGR